MSWKYIFNTGHELGIWKFEGNARDAAKAAGYKFYIWNDWIMSVNGASTGIPAKEAF